MAIKMVLMRLLNWFLASDDAEKELSEVLDALTGASWND